MTTDPGPDHQKEFKGYHSPFACLCPLSCRLIFECPLCRFGLDQLDALDAVRVGRSHAALVVALRRRVVGLCGSSDGGPSPLLPSAVVVVVIAAGGALWGGNFGVGPVVQGPLGQRGAGCEPTFCGLTWAKKARCWTYLEWSLLCCRANRSAGIRNKERWHNWQRSQLACTSKKAGWFGPSFVLQLHAHMPACPYVLVAGSAGCCGCHLRVPVTVSWLRFF